MKLTIFLMAITLYMQAVAFQVANCGEEPQLPARFAPAKPPEPREGALGRRYVGTVTEVTKNSITIEWPGEKPKKFSVSETLASGGFSVNSRTRSSTVFPPFCYRFTDVKVGDRVDIRFAYLDGVSICDHIRIDKRPGGRVPPLPEGAENLKTPSGRTLIPYHERMNALWDLEDKGIPYPEKFGKNRRFPLAPMPRLVGTIGPVISQ